MYQETLSINAPQNVPHTGKVLDWVLQAWGQSSHAYRKSEHLLRIGLSVLGLGFSV